MEPAAPTTTVFFYGNGFATKSSTDANDWITTNNLNNVGVNLVSDYVTGSTGTVTTNIYKWVNLSMFMNGDEAPISFTVPANNLTQTFQIGARENGLDIDKIAFGLSSYYYTVYHLDNGLIGTTTPPPAPFVPTGPPMATGKIKHVGSAHSAAQSVNFTAYWNQVVPENAGKWGSVEATRDVMNWGQLDAAYNLAKSNGFPFRFHILIWGNQQPAWIESLPAAEQLEEINEWFAAVAARYPDIDYLEVVNEPLHDPPNSSGNGGGNYINALGGSGATGWDWIISAFKLARQYFPNTPLMLNDYSIINSTASTTQYLTIINLLKQQGLIDAIAEQGHAFTTRGTPANTLTTNLNRLAATGLPIYITELDIDGPSDQIQLEEFQRVIPLFWEHPGVHGITFWGYRPGHWRTAQGAFMVLANGAERPAMVWLQDYIRNTTPVLTFYRDVDGDGWGRIDATWIATAPPVGYSARSGDCVDWNAAIHPMAPELPNGIDDNCNGSVDEGFPVLTYYKDWDGDGWGRSDDLKTATAQPAGYVLQNGDCSDWDASIHPSAIEVFNWKDDDCDGLTDEGSGTGNLIIYYKDLDADGWGRDNDIKMAMSAPPGYVARNGDCADWDASIHPEAAEVFNWKDDNCNGLVDEVMAAAGMHAQYGNEGIKSKDLTAEKDAITISAYPNPSPQYFTVFVKSSNAGKPVRLRVRDILGRVIESRNIIPANGTLRIGQSYRPGAYILEVLQGSKKVVVKLVKQ